ncbi:MAG: MFS transporter [Myxococcales bacterium]|nr:MFS transporter [Myxococcales bacterium]
MSVAGSSQPHTPDAQPSVSHHVRRYPAGFLPVCFAVLCERCAAFMLASSLVLMLCERFGYPRAEALRLAGLITAAGYLGSLPGGLLSDRMLGHRRGLIVSSLFLTAAYLLLSLPSKRVLWPSLAALIVGNSLFKPSLYVVVRRLFAIADPRFERAQLWLHLVINFAAVLGALIAGTWTQKGDWSVVFSAASLTMLAAWSVLFFGQKRMMHFRNDEPSFPGKQEELTLSSWHRVKSIAMLTLAMVLFNMAFGQVDGSLLLWTSQHVDRTLSGRAIPLPWFVALPSLLVLLIAPVQIVLLPRLQRRLGIYPLVANGLVATSLAFAVLIPADRLCRSHLIGMGWLIACHLLLVVGETLVSPLGLSLVLKLAPPKLLGVVMGVWFVSCAAGYWLAGEVGALWFSLSPTVGMILLTLLPLLGAWVVFRQSKGTGPK